MEEPKPGEKYVHFKGKDKVYEVIVISRDCNNPANKIVTYQSLYSSEEFQAGTIWSRSLEDFVGFKMVEGKKVKRFVKIE